MRRHAVISIIALGALASAAHAQHDAWGSLEAVDPGTADVSPLSESMRLVPIDMRVSDGFERVYRLEGAEGVEDQFARRSGGITAVFSQSVYLPSEFGGGVAIPAGTVFYIGDPPEWMRERYNLGGEADGAPSLGSAATGRIETGISVGAIDTSARVMPALRAAASREGEITRQPSTPWRTDDRRAHRVSSLLSLAATGD